MNILRVWDDLRSKYEVKLPEEQEIHHDWDDQDKCRRCGGINWYPSSKCTPKQQPALDVTVLVEALEDLVSEIESVTCTHDNTHRGGAIWEICEECGCEWADDEGGKPEFSWPESVEKAQALIDAFYNQGGES